MDAKKLFLKKVKLSVAPQYWGATDTIVGCHGQVPFMTEQDK